MTSTPKEVGLTTALLRVQAELKAPKGQFNSFGKYKYRSAEDILEALKPVLAKHGLTLTLSDHIMPYGERYYVRATAEVVKGEDKITVHAFAREEDTKKGMDSSQITGTASSYARKYALNGMFLIDDTKDADTDEHTKARQDAEARAVGLALEAISDASSMDELREVFRGLGKMTSHKDIVAAARKKRAQFPAEPNHEN